MYGVSAMPTFLVFKEGKKVGEVRGADVRGLKAVVDGAAADVKGSGAQNSAGVAEAKVEKASMQTKPAEEKKSDVEEKTISGSYGLNSNRNWKMSLH